MPRKRAKESSRFYLPYANQLTADISFNFRSFMNFVKLRKSEDAQKEIRGIAQQMLILAKETGKFDLSLKAFGWSAEKISE
jgi:thymidylate synthase ThyX